MVTITTEVSPPLRMEGSEASASWTEKKRGSPEGVVPARERQTLSSPTTRPQTSTARPARRTARLTHDEDAYLLKLGGGEWTNGLRRALQIARSAHAAPEANKSQARSYEALAGELWTAWRLFYERSGGRREYRTTPTRRWVEDRLQTLGMSKASAQDTSGPVYACLQTMQRNGGDPR